MQRGGMIPNGLIGATYHETLATVLSLALAPARMRRNSQRLRIHTRLPARAADYQNARAMNFTQTITAIANQLRLDPVELDLWANEDLIGGYHADERYRKWPTGSIWGVEGQILYALIRALKPDSVLELGTYHGCSATHILAALKANGKGTLVCVDNGSNAPYAPAIGHLIPDELRDIVTLIDRDVVEYVQDTTQSYDFIFEDAMHSPAQVEAIWSAAVRGLLNPGGVMVSHDAMHFLVGDDVLRGIGEALVSVPTSDWPYTYLTEPSDCGLAIWRKSKPDVTEVAETPAVNPKRTRKAKA
jgi:predicted O-methyltransferase YrrM